MGNHQRNCNHTKKNTATLSASLFSLLHFIYVHYYLLWRQLWSSDATLESDLWPWLHVCGAIGQLYTFEPDSENIASYLEWVQLYFDVNGVKDDKKVSHLSVQETTPCVPCCLQNRRTRLTMSNSTWLSHLALFTCFQNSSQFIADLRHLAIHILHKFGSFLNKALRDCQSVVSEKT